MAHLALYLFGPFQATLDGQEVTTFATDKARALLAYLAVEADRPHRRDALAGLLWPDLPQARARQSLRQALTRVRKALDDRDPAQPFLLVQQDQVQFNAAGDTWVDVAAFTATLTDCQKHRHRDVSACRHCLGQMERAVALYRRDFLDQFFLPDSAPFEEWTLFKRDWLRQQAMEALAILATYYERRGDYAEAQQYARRQVELEPWCEEAHQQLMRLLAQAGKRSAALAQYESCVRALAKTLGVEPMAETVALYEQIRGGLPAVAPPRHNLPPAPDPLVGREKETGDLAELLSGTHCRLVTLVGPGGVGKTRLALQVAADQVGALADGVYLVPLPATRTVEEVVLTLAGTLGVGLSGRDPPREQLLAYLREKDILLVLDGMERHLEAAGLLADILRQAPGVVLLATSQERLSLREEWVYEVRGLGYPGSAAVPGRGHAAVELFDQRARRAHHAFDLSAEAESVARICQLVDGVPLGIELAAAGVGTYTCAEIAAAIARNLDVLVSTHSDVPERHRSMRATFEHCWSLLDAPQQRAFAGLSVFRGGFGARAAEQVVGALPAELAALQHKSLLARDAAGRYQVHELLRQYAAEQLAASGEEGATQERHGAYYARFLGDQGGRLQGREQKEALAEVAAEIENVRAAWQWAVGARQERVLGAALGGLDLFYELQSWYQEGHAAFSQAAAALQARGPAGLVLHQVLARQARFAQRLGQNEPARELLTRSLEFFRGAGERREEALALNLLAEVYMESGDYAQALALSSQALALGEELGDPHSQFWTLVNLGDIAALQGDYAAAQSYCTRGLALSQATGAPLRLASALSNLGRIAAILGDYGQAGEQFRASLALYRELGQRRGMAGCLNNLGSLAYLAADYAQARQLRQETLAICQEIGFRWGVANTLKSLGDIARQQGRPGEAQQYLERALAAQQEMGDVRAQANTLSSLGALALDRGDSGQAGQHFRRALLLSVEAGALPVTLDVLSRVAAILAAQGQAGEALELNALVLAHPAAEQQTRDRAEKLRGELAAQLAPGLAAAAEARGRAGRIEEIVGRIVKEDGAGRSP